MADAISLPFEAEEAWRPIPGFEGVYEVSDHGRVRRVGEAAGHNGGARIGRILRPPIGPDGYPRVFLWRDGKQYPRLVHRLVALAFLGPCPADHEVNHRDGVRSNPRLTNLEYVTRSENILHAYRALPRAAVSGPTGEAHHNAKLTAEAVAEIRRRYKPGVYGTPRLGREFGVNAKTVHDIVTGKRWKESQ